jgi:3-hydroxyisobutyrate dehydrogenase
MNVGYIGLGAMGGALAGHLVRKHSLSVLDLNRDTVARFVDQGAHAAMSGSEVARRSEVVMLCLPRSTDVRQVLFGPDGVAEGLSPGSVVIDQTSGVPAETREFARQLESRGVAMIDAPVSGAMATAIAGTVSIIASGPRKTYDRVRPLLADISRNVFHVGDTVGNGQTMKAVNNMLNASCRLASLELAAMGRKYGLTMEAMIAALNATTATNFTTRGMFPAIAEGRQSTKFRLVLQLKDAYQALEMGAETDVPMPLCNLAAGMLQVGVNQLGQDAQLEQIIGVIEQMAATRYVADQAQGT